jgi:hypothetical protein
MDALENGKRRTLGVLVGSTRTVAASGEERFTLDPLDLDAGDPEPVRMSLDFFGHGLAIHPRSPSEAVLLGKRGPRGCVLDLAARRVVRPIAPMRGHAFYGHAAYSSEGDALFIVETHLETRQGSISIRDSSTFDVLGVFPTYGRSPHDCHLVEDGKTLVITNGGGPIDSPFLPSVAFVDVASHALVEKHEVLDRARGSGHIAIAENREFAMVSAPREGQPATTSLGGVTLRRQGERWIHMMSPEAVTSRLFGESLSVVVHDPSRTVLATHPDSDLITFWNLDRGALLTRLDVPGPRGVTMTLDEQLYIVSYGTEARLLVVQANPLEVLSERRLATGIFGGAHLYTWGS